MDQIRTEHCFKKYLPGKCLSRYLVAGKRDWLNSPPRHPLGIHPHPRKRQICGTGGVDTGEHGLLLSYGNMILNLGEWRLLHAGTKCSKNHWKWRNDLKQENGVSLETWILKQTLSLKLNPCRQHILRSSIKEETLPKQRKQIHILNTLLVVLGHPGKDAKTAGWITGTNIGMNPTAAALLDSL